MKLALSILAALLISVYLVKSARVHGIQLTFLVGQASRMGECERLVQGLRDAGFSAQMTEERGLVTLQICHSSPSEARAASKQLLSDLRQPFKLDGEPPSELESRFTEDSEQIRACERHLISENEGRSSEEVLQLALRRYRVLSAQRAKSGLTKELWKERQEMRSSDFFVISGPVDVEDWNLTRCGFAVCIGLAPLLLLLRRGRGTKCA